MSKLVRILLKIGFIVFGILSYSEAQTTQIYTGVIKDLTGAVVTSGQVTFTLALPNAATVPGTGTFVPTTVPCNINSDGTLSGFVGGSVSGACTVIPNISLTPVGTAYRICEQPYFVTPGSCFYDYALGGTKDISSIVPTLPTGPINYGGVPGPPGPAAVVTMSGASGPFSALNFNGSYLLSATTPMIDVRAYGAVPGGTDSTAAFQAAINAAAATGATLYIPPNQFTLNGAINSACNAILCVPIATSGAAKQLRITGTTKARQDSNGSITGTVLATTTTGVDQFSAIIAVPPASVGQFNNLDLYVSDIDFRTVANPTVGCLNGFWAAGASFTNIKCENGESYSGGHTQPTNVAIAYQMPSVNNDTLSVLSHSEATGYYIGLTASEHADIDMVTVGFGIIGVQLEQGFHTANFNLFQTEEVATPIVWQASLPVNFQGLDIETDSANFWGCRSWCYSGNDISDASNFGSGFISFRKVTGGCCTDTTPPVIVGGVFLNLYDMTNDTWSIRATNHMRTGFSVGGSTAVNGDAMFPAMSSQRGDVDLVFGNNNDSAGTGLDRAGILQVYSAGSGNMLGTSHYTLQINPFGGNVFLGSASANSYINGETYINNGFANTTGLQKIRAPVGCTTAASIGAACTTTTPITWPVTWPDLLFTVSCSLNTPTGLPAISSVTKSMTTLAVTIVAQSAVAATANLDCVAVHD